MPITGFSQFKYVEIIIYAFFTFVNNVYRLIFFILFHLNIRH